MGRYGWSLWGRLSSWHVSYAWVYPRRLKGLRMGMSSGTTDLVQAHILLNNSNTPAVSRLNCRQPFKWKKWWQRSNIIWKHQSTLVQSVLHLLSPFLDHCYLPLYKSQIAHFDMHHRVFGITLCFILSISLCSAVYFIHFPSHKPVHIFHHYYFLHCSTTFSIAPSTCIFHSRLETQFSTNQNPTYRTACFGFLILNIFLFLLLSLLLFTDIMRQ